MLLEATPEAPAERAERVAAQYTRPGLRSAAAALQVVARLVAVAPPGLLVVARSWGIHCKQGELRGRIAGKSR